MRLVKYLLVILVIVSGLVIYNKNHLVNPNEKQIQNETEKFAIKDYKEYIRRFPSKVILGKIESQDNALQKAKKIWKQIYGKDYAENLISYSFLFDSKEKVWLISGNLNENFIGGVPYILIEENEGRVLAVWHDK